MTLLISGNFNVNNHAHVLKGTDSCATEWFFLFFLHRDIYKYITRQGAGRYKLNKDALKEMPIALPTLSERKKIAKILSTWGTAIEQIRKLIQTREFQFGIQHILLADPPGGIMQPGDVHELRKQGARLLDDPQCLDLVVEFQEAVA